MKPAWSAWTQKDLQGEGTRQLGSAGRAGVRQRRARRCEQRGLEFKGREAWGSLAGSFRKLGAGQGAGGESGCMGRPKGGGASLA